MDEIKICQFLGAYLALCLKHGMRIDVACGQLSVMTLGETWTIEDHRKELQASVIQEDIPTGVCK